VDSIAPGRDFRQVLKERLATFYDNAVMESFFATVKSELADRFDLPQFLAEALRHE
jgi:transposase InsO family protein